MDDWLLDGSTSGNWRDMVMEDYPLANPEWFVLDWEEQLRITRLCESAVKGVVPVRTWQMKVGDSDSKVYCVTCFNSRKECQAGILPMMYGEVTQQYVGLSELDCPDCGSWLDVKLGIGGCEAFLGGYRTARFPIENNKEWWRLLKTIDRIGFGNSPFAGIDSVAACLTTLHRLCRKILTQLDNPAPPL